MDTRKIRHFLALVEHGSFRRAAEAIPLSQSALSRSIQALEQELGAPLFDRDTQRVRITPFGRALVARARRVLFETNELHRELTLLRGGDLGRVSLGLSPTPASVCLRACLSALAVTHPRLQVGVSIGRTADLLEGLRAEKYDLAIVDNSAIDDPQGLVIEQLTPLAGGFLCRRGHPLARRKSVTIDDIRRYPVACSPVSRAFAQHMIRAFGEAGHPDRLVTLFCDNYEIQREVALAGDLILMSVFAIVNDDLLARRLVQLATTPRLELQGRYALVTLQGRTQPPALELFCHEARRRFVA